ncbi:TonB family protein [Dyella acidiphila]|uniref:TonB family protein n=1 Tax=Dyella acidiphila TaxID=2775866 RepID=A0ABR9GG64_9GAMM|nr:TonB family protein [Dyella acidiphila]MBE1163046.1 TonB family protein [Dyella acidiphila]
MTIRACTVTVLLLGVCLSANAQTDASITHSTLQYPASAVLAKEEGVVLVDVETDAGGHAINARVEKSSGFPDLDAAAVQGISQGSFLAGTKDGKPQSQWIRVPVYFDLKTQTTTIGAWSATSLLIVYAAAIQNQVSAHWQRPENLPQQPCVVEIKQQPDGQVTHIEIRPGCPYDEADKKSLIDAVTSASPLPYKGFESVFQKTLDFTFMP